MTIPYLAHIPFVVLFLVFVLGFITIEGLTRGR